MFNNIGKEAGEKILKAAEQLRIEKASENIKEAAQQQKIGLITMAKIIKEGAIITATIVMGGIILNTLLKK